jgi:hypothetical protein
MLIIIQKRLKRKELAVTRLVSKEIYLLLGLAFIDHEILEDWYVAICRGGKESSRPPSD